MGLPPGVGFEGVDFEGIDLEEIVRGAGLGVTEDTAADAAAAEAGVTPRRDLSALCDRAEGRGAELGTVVKELAPPPLLRDAGGLAAGDNDTERLEMESAGPSGDSMAFGGERGSSAMLCPRLRILQLSRSAPTASRFMSAMVLLLLLPASGPELELPPPPTPADATDPVRIRVMPSILKEPLQ